MSGGHPSSKRRPANDRWEVLGEPTDPLPGDPAQIARLGRQLRKTADRIERQADEIKALASVENWKGKAAKQFRDNAEGASGRLRKAFDRYDEAAKALGTQVKEGVCSTEYASELHRAQELADAALAKAEEADGEKSKAEKGLENQSDDDSDNTELENQKTNAETALGKAKEDLQTAKEIRDGAAKRAADAIKEVVNNDGLKDSAWDKFKSWVKENSGWLSKLSSIMGKIALWAGVAALVVGWIPVVGQALAGVLTAVALVASVVALASDLVLALGGEKGWDAVLLSAVGVATFGVGRAALAGAKGASAAAKALSRSNLYKSARQAGAGVNKAWKIANKGAPGAARGKEAAKAMANAPKRNFPSLSNLKEGFSPKAIAKDTRDAVTSRMPGLNAPRGPATADPDLARAADGLSNIDPKAINAPSVQGALNAFNGNAQVWAGSTATGVGAGYTGAHTDGLPGDFW